MAYATTTQLYALGVPEAALTGVTGVSIALDAASRLVDSYFAARYSVPLVSPGDDVVRATSIIAAYDLMVTRGYNPESTDEQLRLRYLDVIKWLENISNGTALPSVSPEELPGTSAMYGVSVYTEDERGW